MGAEFKSKYKRGSFVLGGFTIPHHGRSHMFKVVQMGDLEVLYSACGVKGNLGNSTPDLGGYPKGTLCGNCARIAKKFVIPTLQGA